MKLFNLKKCIIVCFDHEIDDFLLSAKQMAQINPDLEILLLLVFRGNKQLADHKEKNLPDNLKLTRYPCNRVFDADFAVTCFFLKQKHQEALVLRLPLAVKMPKRRFIFNPKGINEISINNQTSGVLLLRNKLLLSHQKDINSSRIINQYLLHSQVSK